MSLAALIPVASASSLEMEEKARVDALDKQNSPFIQSLAAYVQEQWAEVRDSRSEIDERLAACLRQRNGEYDPAKLQEIAEFGGSKIFLNLTSVKCRGASSWLRDTLLGTGADKPWQLEHTPVPELPSDAMAEAHKALSQMVMQYMAMNGGVPPPHDMVRQQAEQMRDVINSELQKESQKRVERMESKMEDQLSEGGYILALSQFIDDIVTFPTAILKGPVARKRKALKWNGTVLEPTEEIRLEWERVDPFKFYPKNWMSSVNDGAVIERHKLTRTEVEAMLGVDGYDEMAIREVLREFDAGGLRNWTTADQIQFDAEGRENGPNSQGDLIEAIQLWDNISGQLLQDWGMDKAEIPDAEKSYPAEVWLVGHWVIRAVLNYDPLGRKPYYTTSYEKVPGSFWGNGVPDLIRDCQQMVNAGGRALSNNMGLSSGPQVGVNIDRLPRGAKVSKMHPWKMWQFKSSDYADSSKPIEFFQPQSNAAEIVAVIEKWWTMADEVSGIPRYMTGEHAPGAGRTASGLSMLISNASKGLKQVISNIDKDCMVPMLERLYQHNLRYSEDTDLIGDVNIVAKGAMSLVAKESAAVRRNEFLQLALSSPIVQQILGIGGVTELLRDAAKALDMNVNNVVPNTQQSAMPLPMMSQQANPQAQTLLPDGSVAGGRDGSLMVNKVTGSNGLGR